VEPSNACRRHPHQQPVDHRRTAAVETFGPSAAIVADNGTTEAQPYLAVYPASGSLTNGGSGANEGLIAGRDALMAEAGGAGLFELTAPVSTATPTKTRSPYFRPNPDKIAFGKQGFALGSAPVAATLFMANKTGVFTSAA
jgi:hypothetical protein